ncbi:MAG: DnaJ domain-containing protein [Sulfurospirillaceae bacterium]|nr:DnaJ domain-containing protein [Sulfurospirillaceae bacterium]
MRKDITVLIQDALEIMDLPSFIDMKELKKQYKYLANLNHPDFGGDEDKMAKINKAYELLKGYMTNFKFSFTDEEIYKQYPEEGHTSKFKF